MRVMAVDYGDSRTGVAISDLLCSIAGSTTVIHSRNAEKTISELCRLVEENDVGKIAVGLPKNMDGSSGERTEVIKAFGEGICRDGDIDRPDDEAYADSMFLNANSRQAPQVVDAKVQPIIDQSEVYSGCYGRVSVTFYAYNSNGNKGVAAGLGNIQKLKDGTPLGSRANAKEEFEAVEAEDDFLS